MTTSSTQRWNSVRWLLAMAFVGFAVSAVRAQGAGAERAWISRDGYFFLHARPAQLWKGDMGAKLRQGFGAPAETVAHVLEAMLGAPPDEIESVTLVGQSVRSTRGFFSSRPRGVKMEPKEPADFKEKRPLDEKKFEPRDKEFPLEKREFEPQKDLDSKDFGFKDKKEFKKGPPDVDNYWKDKAAELMPEAAVKIVTTAKPYDKAKVTKALLRGKTLERQIAGKTYVVSSESFPWAVHFASDRTYVIAAPPLWMEKLLEKGAAAKGPLADAVEAALKQHDLVIAFNFTEPSALAMKAEIARSLDNPWNNEPTTVFRPLLNTKSATFTLDLGKETKLQAVLAFPDAARAEKALLPADDAVVLMRIFLLGSLRQKLYREVEESSEPMGPMFFALLVQQAEDALRGVKITRSQAELRGAATAKIDVDALRARTKGEVDALLADEAGRDSRNRRLSVNNLKQIMLAMHSFHDANRMLPPPAICSKETGMPLLSWRVLILPYIDEFPLYNEFKLNEPWDSPHNIKLLPRMPKVYLAPGVKKKEQGVTYYQVLVGAETAFPLMPDKNAPFGARNGTLIGITDGTSNTLGVVEAHSPVPWTKPDDLVYDAKKPLPKMGGTITPGGFNTGFMDATVRYIRAGTDEKTIRALITRAGGEFVQLPDD